MRELWLPALEWFFSERLERLLYYGKPSNANGEELSDEAVLAAADFVLFIE